MRTISHCVLVIAALALLLPAHVIAYTNHPLFDAIENGDLAQVKQLVNQSNLNAIVHSDEVTYTTAPLAWACASQEYEIAGYLLDRGADPNGSTFYDTALWWIAYQSQFMTDDVYRLAEKMLKKGATPDLAKSENNGTPLMIAAAKNSRKLVDLLLRYGADKNLVLDRENGNAATYAERAGNIELANYLKGANNDGYRNSLIYAVRQNDLDRVRSFLEGKGDDERRAGINKAEEKSLMTPLHYAAKGGFLEMSRLLVEGGADINPRAQGSFTPLMFAAAYGMEDVGMYLVNAGAKINVVQTSGCATGFTSLNWAVQGGRYTLVSLMLEKGADASVCSPNPLITARDLTMARILVKGGVSPDEGVMATLRKSIDDNRCDTGDWRRERERIYQYLRSNVPQGGGITVRSAPGMNKKGTPVDKSTKSGGLFEPYNINVHR